MQAATLALPAGTLPVAAATWLSSGQATQARSGNVLTVQQASPQAIFNWQSFNIAPGSTVRFNQPSATSQALNRIGDAQPSVIQGALQANGRVWLVNANGIIFGQGAQVDVAGLVASPLHISDSDFLAGILSASAQGAPAFSGDATGFVRVEAGARISTPTGGQVLIFAPSIEHQGLIQTPDGQTLLAAGQKIYLSASEDASLRGMKVEVSSGGSVLNLGDIVAERGNITLAGLAVNQSGRLRASTTVSRNGSVWLQAVERDEGAGAAPGTLTLGAHSVTEVAPELGSTETSTDAQVVLKSQVQMAGHTITLEEGAQVLAHAGQVGLDASGSTTATSASARVFVDQGALIDVSGLSQVELPLSRNFLQFTLTSNELADAPVQRAGPLLGETVTVDLRQGTPFANFSAALAQVPRTVAERSTAGGQITVSSAGDVVLKAGSSLNVSGGSVHFDAGWGGASQLRLGNGKLVDIGVADPAQVYLGLSDVVQVSHDKWGLTDTYELGTTRHFNAAFDQGMDAGAVAITAAQAVLEGQMQGRATPGAYQRAGSQLPKGGMLTLVQTSDVVGLAPGLNIQAKAQHSSARMQSGDALTDAQAAAWVLGADTVQQGGFSRLDLTASGDVALAADARLELGAGGSFALRHGGSSTGTSYGGDIWLGGGIHTAGGTISVTSTGSATQGQITLGAQGVLDVAGQWGNDQRDAAQGAAIIQGGQVSLQSAAGLTLERGSVVDVSAGAWLKRSGALASGNAGSLTLVASRGKDGGAQNNTRGGDGPLVLSGELRAYGLGKQGGTLNLKADGLALGSAAGVSSPRAGSSADTAIDLGDLAGRGFATIGLTAWDRLSVWQDQTAPVVRSMRLPGQAFLQHGAGSLAGLAQVQTLALDQRPAMQLSLPLSTVAMGSALKLDPGSTITVAGGECLVVDGALSAPGGKVSLSSAAVWSDGAAWSVDLGSAPGVWLGDQAVIDVSGVAVSTTDARGGASGTVLAGGEVDLSATNGVVHMAAGARILASGAEATLDLGAPAGIGARQAVSNAGGTVRVSSNVGVALGGTMQAFSGGAGAQGGTLAVALTEPDPRNLQAAPLAIELQAQADGSQASALMSQMGLGPSVLDSGMVSGGGFDVLSLASHDEIRWSGDVRLQLGRSISLDAPNLAADGAATLDLAAPYVALGHTDALRQTATQAATPGTARLSVDADNIDVQGWWATQGLGQISLRALQDIRLQGALSGNTQSAVNTTVANALTGGLRTQASLSLSAQQVYPTSLSQYTLDVQGAGGTLQVAQAPGPAAMPLSALGSLSLHADHIDVGGTLCAPLGQITLEADSNLTLASGARVSTSGQGLLTLMGYTEAEAAWYYGLDAALGDSTRLSLSDLGQGKSIRLNAARTSVAAGATLDVSGGGDLLAWAWQAGPGGSRDVLAAAGTWAILPALGSRLAPRDWQNDQSSGLHAGDAVHLSGIAGLADGTYTLLPAHFALLPGAYALRLSAQNSDMQATQNVVRPDGSYLVAGRKVVLGTGVQDSRSSSFDVLPGAVVRQYSQYVETLEGSAGQASSLVQDAGHVALAATQALAGQGQMRLGADHGQRGDVDVSAPHIEVVSALSTDPSSDGALEGSWQVGSDTLSAWGAHSLLLGGTRGAVDSTGATGVTVGAQTVRVANDAAHSLQAEDLILVAQSDVSLEAGASVQAQAQVSGGAAGSAQAVSVSGVVLRASADSGGTVHHADEGAGQLHIGAGATVRAGAGLVLGASVQDVSPTAVLKTPSLTLAADRIHIGTPQTPTQTPQQSQAAGLGLDAASWPWVGSDLQTLTLQAGQGLHLYGSLALGGADALPELGTLVLDTPWLVSEAGAQAVLSAGTLIVQNTSGQTAPAQAASLASASTAVPAASTTLSLQASADLIVGAGQTRLSGASETRMQAGGELRFQGDGLLTVDGALRVQTDRVTAGAGAHNGVVVQGDAQWLPASAGTLNTAGADGASGHASPAGGLGAKLSLRANSLWLATQVELDSGQLSIQTTQDLALAAGARLSVQGVDTRFFDQLVGSDAGHISLSSSSGQVRLNDGATLDLSGTAHGGANGQLSVQAAQAQIVVQSGARIQTRVADGVAGADISLDAQSLGDLAVLHDVLDASGGIGQLSLRARAGDLNVAEGQVWRAGGIELVADQGRIHVDGALVADPAGAGRGGQVSLWAGGALSLGDTATLKAAGQGAQAGQITLAQMDGTQAMSLAQGARIDLSSADGSGAGGGLTLRVPRMKTPGSASDDGLALDAVGATVTGADHVDIEAFKVYNGIHQIGTASGSGLLNTATVASDNSAFMGHAADIVQRAGLDPALAVHLRPGVEVRSTGDLTLANDWNLYAATRPGGEAGVLTLRAAGNLKLQGSLSDGFASAAVTAAVQAGPSWSYRLTGGADLGSASPAATADSTGPGTGDVSLAAAKLLRTGTGSIDIHAGGSVVLQGASSAIYTAGRLAPALPDFSVPLRYGAAYTQGGGDVSIDAAGDVRSLVASTQDSSAWLYRSGTGPGTTSWWVSFKDFAQGVAALGGGQVRVHAGGDVRDLSAGTASNGRLATGSDTPQVLGGGNLSVRADGNIQGGVFTVMSGQGRLQAGGSIGTGALGLAPMLAMGRSSFTVRGGGAVAINAAYQPTLLPSGNVSVLGTLSRNFSLDGGDASLDLMSVTGDVSLVNDAEGAREQFKHGNSWDPALADSYLSYPGRVQLAAPLGSVAIAGDMTLLPSAQGGLTVLAQHDVTVNGSVTESALAPDTELATPSHPAYLGLVAADVTPRSASLLHADDPVPSRLYAVQGGITGPNDGQLGRFAEPVLMRAGGDIVSAGIDATHLRSTDLSLLEAGGSIRFKTPLNPTGGLTTNNQSLTVNGPGVVALLAGSDIDLGSSVGVNTIGNLKNPDLPAQGAQVIAAAGLGRDAAGQLRMPSSLALLDSLLASPTQHDATLSTLNAWLMAQGQAVQDADADAARAAFLASTPEQQLVLSGRLLIDVLGAAGRAHAASPAASAYAAGEAAVHSLFPLTGNTGNTAYKGDIRLYYSQIRTQLGGDITLLTPGGLVNAGLANPTFSFSKSASQLGIVTVKGGRVGAYASGDIRVNQSRVFTMDGGDIMLWSDQGGIDAGRGAKTAAYAPAPTLIVHDDGRVEYDSSAAASGSGIGVLITDPNVPAGDVILVAPMGTVDAGEAGVRARRNVYIAALRVQGTREISAGGQRLGVPVMVAPAAGLTSLNTGADATQAVNQALEQLQTAAGRRTPVASRFTVEVLDGP